VLNNEDCPDGVAVRFVCQESGISLVLDNEKPDDSKIEHEGRTVLLLDQTAAEHLAEERLDVEQAEDGVKMFLTREDPGSAS
jgi:hypothetical protein